MFLRALGLALLTACQGAQDARARAVDTTAVSKPTAAAAAVTPSVGTTTERGGPDAMVARADSARIRGSATAKVWMIIASDFQCPYCKMWHDTADMTIRREYIDNGKVRLAFVNFPLSMHPNAMPAAEYAMCAAAQDKFWPMHDSLFAAQARWAGQSDPSATLEEIARSVGADVAALKQCVSGHTMRPLIEADREKASRAGVRATPSFFIGNQMLEGVQMPSDLRRALDAALASAGAR